jgi:glutamate-5-semialdehyde dehydrogenase
MGAPSGTREIALRAQAALPALAASGAKERNRFLTYLAGLIIDNGEALIHANGVDMEAAEAKGLSGPLLDRLSLTAQGVRGLARGILDVAALPDPLGRIEEHSVLENGLGVGRMRVPLGLIAFICEARPGAVAEAAAMAVKSGNALVARPGSEAKESATMIGGFIREALKWSGLPEDAVAVLAGSGREAVMELVSLEGIVDLAIPRGGEGLIRHVTENSLVPVLRHYKGVCHLYVDLGSDLEMATNLIINGKASRPGTCNALECLLVHQDEAEGLFRLLVPEMLEKGITVRAHQNALPLLKKRMGAKAEKADPSDWGREYLDLIMAVKLVSGLDEALEHIRLYG